MRFPPVRPGGQRFAGNHGFFYAGMTFGDYAVHRNFVVEKNIGDKVTGGTVNGTGGFVMRAEKIGSDTLLAQIVNLVAEAQRSRAPIQGLVDKVATIFVPTGYENNLAFINHRIIKRVFLGVKHLGHFGRQEVLQIVSDGFAHTAKLFFGLIEKAVVKCSCSSRQ